MAIFALSLSIIQRSKGQSATAAIAYRSASKIMDDRTGMLHNFTSKSGVVSSQIFVPDGVLVPERSALWNMAEAAEKRKDSATARDILIALPADLSDDQRQELVNDFSQFLVGRWGVGVDANVHRPSQHGDSRNHHAHLLITMRQIRPDGSHGNRVASLASQATGSDELIVIRQHWADVCNTSLRDAGIDQSVSSATLQSQRIEAEVAASVASSAADTHAALDRASLLDRLPEPKIGWRAQRWDRIAITKGDGQVSDVTRIVRGIRTDKLRKTNKILWQRDSAKSTNRIAKINHPDFLDQVSKHFRKRIYQYQNRGVQIQPDKIYQAFLWINNKLKPYNLQIPEKTINFMRDELTRFSQRSESKPFAKLPNFVPPIQEKSQTRDIGKSRRLLLRYWRLRGGQVGFS